MSATGLMIPLQALIDDTTCFETGRTLRWSEGVCGPTPPSAGGAGLAQVAQAVRLPVRRVHLALTVHPPSGQAASCPDPVPAAYGPRDRRDPELGAAL